MLKRITVLTIAAATLAVLLFAVPLGIVASRGFVADQRLELQRDAVSVASALRGEVGSAVAAGLTSAGTEVAVYDDSGRLRTGTPTTAGAVLVARALAGHEATSSTDAYAIVAAPISDGDQVTGVVVLQRSLDEANHRSTLAWFALFGLGAVAVAVAALAAQFLARRLVAPVTRLTTVAQRVSDGDLGARAELTGIRELDLLARNVNTGVERVAELIERERRLSAEVSHQLRTPVTGLRLQLEQLQDGAAGAEVDGVLVTLGRLEDTIAEVIGLARGPRVDTDTDLSVELEAAAERWHGLFAAGSRPLRIDVVGPAGQRWCAAISAPATAQILDVLLDNAYSHGRGTTTMRLREAHGALAVDVADEGPTLPSIPSALQRRPPADTPVGTHGLGLRFARRLAEAAGARVLVSTRTPPTFTLLVAAPPREPAAGPASEVGPT